MSWEPKSIAVIGASGAIGGALIKNALSLYPKCKIHAFSRAIPKEIISEVDYKVMDFSSEESINQCAAQAARQASLDLVFVTTGILHTDDFQPEKSLKELSREAFHELYEVNTVIPALMAKYFLPKLSKDKRSIFAALSARVGSISDNQLGGWYSYRASKAALNMFIKCASIEVQRSNQNAIVVGLHPGTVDSNLSKPFQSHLPKGQLFTPDQSAGYLLNVLQELNKEDTGKCFAWDGKEILP